MAAVPFSSARKWSATSFAGHGTWVLGAPEILLVAGAPDDNGVKERVDGTGRRRYPYPAPGPIQCPAAPGSR